MTLTRLSASGRCQIHVASSQCTWLLTELESDGLLFGLCDLGEAATQLKFVQTQQHASKVSGLRPYITSLDCIAKALTTL